MENENLNTETKEELVQEFPQLENLMAAGTEESEKFIVQSSNSAAAETSSAQCVHWAPSPEGKANAGAGEVEAVKAPDPVPQLQKDLEAALGRVQQLERERWLLSQGVPEEDLDYYAFKIGTLVTPEKDFATAAKDYLKNHRGPRTGGISTAAGLGGRLSKVPGINETMNRLIRGNL